MTASIGPTRRVRLHNHIANTIETDPEAAWIFTADHQYKSASPARLVAARRELDIDLGVKEKSHSQPMGDEGRGFCPDLMHRIRFVYITLILSWFNQIEIWFSIL